MGNRVLALIAAALIVWGGYHALGAYLFNHNPWRAVVVAACMGSFLGFWYAMLQARKRRLAAASHDTLRTLE
jgi:hypothetical protein